MTGFILCDTPLRESLLPFTYIRPIADCRTGILTIREKWEYRLKQPVITEGAAYLRNALSPQLPESETFYWINGALLPDDGIVEALLDLKPGEGLFSESIWLADHRTNRDNTVQSPLITRVYDKPVLLLRHPWDFCQLNDEQIRKDFLLITAGRTTIKPDPHTVLIQPDQVFIEAGARVQSATLNASTGPIYIGENAEIMEGAHIRGPFALGAGAVVKMGATIYGATTLGPGSVGGGEIKNSVFFGYSNKAHEGYLGDAVIGEWCNLGAGTTCSNLKNNLSPVMVWDEQGQASLPAGLKCGLLMGDFSRTGIQTTFNTGSLVGVSTHVFGAGMPPTYLSSFLWTGKDGSREYRLGKAISDARAWKGLKGALLSSREEAVLTDVFKQTSSYRKSILNT